MIGSISQFWIQVGIPQFPPMDFHFSISWIREYHLTLSCWLIFFKLLQLLSLSRPMSSLPVGNNWGWILGSQARHSGILSYISCSRSKVTHILQDLPIVASTVRASLNQPSFLVNKTWVPADTCNVSRELHLPHGPWLGEWLLSTLM